VGINSKKTVKTVGRIKYFANTYIASRINIPFLISNPVGLFVVKRLIAFLRGTRYFIYNLNPVYYGSNFAQN
jgi:hypothetical protein